LKPWQPRVPRPQMPPMNPPRYPTMPAPPIDVRPSQPVPENFWREPPGLQRYRNMMTDPIAKREGTGLYGPLSLAASANF
jgi:hypothetical protein